MELWGEVFPERNFCDVVKSLIQRIMMHAGLRVSHDIANETAGEDGKYKIINNGDRSGQLRLFPPLASTL